MPQQARIFLVEDDILEVQEVKYFLEKADHKIVAEAKSLEEALNLIPQLSEKGINIAIVDGNLTSGDSSGKDGQTVATAIRKQSKGIKIVAYSGKKYDYGDVFMPKGLTVEAMRKFAETITAL